VCPHRATRGGAADYLAIPKATLRTWRTRRAGFGPRAVKMGGCLRFRRSDLDDWILTHQEAVSVSPTPDEGVSSVEELRPQVTRAWTRRSSPTRPVEGPGTRVPA
jgi:hypothetical protein